MKKNYEVFMEKNFIKELADLNMYHVGFIRDVHTYMNMLLSSDYANQFIYNGLGKKVYKYPHIGFLGKVALSNRYMEPLQTCLRYAVLENAEKESKLAKTILDEVVTRLEKSQRVIPTLLGEDLKKAEAVYNALYSTMENIQCGLYLMSEMGLFKAGHLDAMDRRKSNKYAQTWIDVYKEYEVKSKWGF